jgi:hypothetical protein
MSMPSVHVHVHVNFTSLCFSARDGYKNQSKIFLEPSGYLETKMCFTILSGAEKDAWLLYTHLFSALDGYKNPLKLLLKAIKNQNCALKSSQEL